MRGEHSDLLIAQGALRYSSACGCGSAERITVHHIWSETVRSQYWITDPAGSLVPLSICKRITRKGRGWELEVGGGGCVALRQVLVGCDESNNSQFFFSKGLQVATQPQCHVWFRYYGAWVLPYSVGYMVPFWRDYSCSGCIKPSLTIIKTYLWPTYPFKQHFKSCMRGYKRRAPCVIF